MLGLKQRIAVTAVLVISAVPSGSKAFTIEECSDAVERDYANCSAGSYYQNFGQCENRRAQGRAFCLQGRYVPPGASQKDQCLTRVQAEWANCGYRNVCANRWIQGLQECNSYPG